MENKEKLDIRNEFEANNGEQVRYHIYEREKTREEKTTKEYANDIADTMFDAMIESGKNIIRGRIEILESELRTEKALREIVKTNMESVLILCRRAMEEGKLDKEVYKMISLVRTEGHSENYIPENYKSL